jgi:peptidyl-prolyl cis-trans isomerase SurA
MFVRRALISASLLGALSWTAPAWATIVERVVAIVGDRPILLSDVRQRTLPFYKTLPPNPTERAAALSTLYSQMLEKMVEEELIARAAVKAQVQVTREEVDAALDRVAKGNGVEVEALFAEVEASGISRAQYRNEIRRQLTDAKVVNLRVQGRLRVSEDEVRREYDALVEEERKQLLMRAAVIRIADSGQASAELARSVAERARAGADFGELCRQHCTDEQLRQSAGLLPSGIPSDLPKELARATASLEVGQVSSPIKSGKDWVIVTVVERDPSALPPFEDAVNQLSQRVQLKKMEKARADWLKTLRKQHHVRIRL